MVDPIMFIFLTILGASLEVISTQNPVYSGLYLVLLFFLGSAISFLLIYITSVYVCVCVCVCVCVFIKLHLTTQSGPVILVILCHSHCVCV